MAYSHLCQCYLCIRYLPRPAPYGQSGGLQSSNSYGSVEFWPCYFSLAGTIRCLPEFVHILTSEGMQQSYCSSSYYRDVRITIWYWLFVWSKVIELGDTIFIILRKQKLIFLHWIHHVLTLSYAFFVIGDAPGTARWMVSMNFAIHTAMYSYYA